MSNHAYIRERERERERESLCVSLRYGRKAQILRKEGRTGLSLVASPAWVLHSFKGGLRRGRDVTVMPLCGMKSLGVMP